MSDKRMFTKQITDAEDFYSMPSSTQATYFHLCQGADDDGFNNSVSLALFKAHGTPDDLKVLLAKKYILGFENGVIVIKHWRMHNYIRRDTYKETSYKELLDRLDVKENGSYTFRDESVTTPLLTRNEPVTKASRTRDESVSQIRLDKIRLDKNNNINNQYAHFDAFWSAYPNKKSKESARKSWAKLNVDDALFDAIMDGLSRAKKSKQWTKDGGQFIPYPATWLNQKRWNDEYDEVRTAEGRKIDDERFKDIDF